MRLAARQARCARDNLTCALSESAEVDRRDSAALLEKHGYYASSGV
jgi:hypothetical protein